LARAIAGLRQAGDEEKYDPRPARKFVGAFDKPLLTYLESALAAAGEGPAIILVMGTGSASFGGMLRRRLHALEDTGLHPVIKGAHMILAGVRLRAAMRERVSGNGTGVLRQADSGRQLRCTVGGGAASCTDNPR